MPRGRAVLSAASKTLPMISFSTKREPVRGRRAAATRQGCYRFAAARRHLLALTAPRFSRGKLFLCRVLCWTMGNPAPPSPPLPPPHSRRAQRGRGHPLLGLWISALGPRSEGTKQWPCPLLPTPRPHSESLVPALPRPATQPSISSRQFHGLPVNLLLQLPKADYQAGKCPTAEAM